MSGERVAIVFRRLRSNRYSLAALVSAIDVKTAKGELQLQPRVVFADTPGELLSLAAELKARGYRVLAAYSFMTTSLPSLLGEIREVTAKLRAAGVASIAGGPHASGDPIGTLMLGFDYVVIGDGEESLPYILKAMAKTKGPVNAEDLSRAPGVAFRNPDDGTYCYTGKAMADLDRYPNFPYWRGIYAPIELTRGCNFACRFCQVSFTHGGRLRHRRLGLVLEMAEALLSSNRGDLRFISPNAFSYLGDGRRPNVDALCLLLDSLEGLIERYGGRVFLGSFPSEVRPEHAAVDEAVGCIAGRVANRRVIIGAQSGSDRILRLMNRGHRVDDVIAAVETLNAHGFLADVDIIVGFPGETRDDLEETVRLSELLVSRYKARIHAHFYLPLPGTPISHLRPSEPDASLLRRLLRLSGSGRLYGEWLRQRELSARLVELYEKGVILGLRGLRLARRCRAAPRLYPSSPSAS